MLAAAGRIVKLWVTFQVLTSELKGLVLMSMLDILHYPDTRLRTVAKPVAEVDGQLQSLIDGMLETMYAAPGIGLAATQVNVHQRLLVIDISEDQNQPLCLINPEILARDGEEEMEEGCLSVPGIYEKVKRAERIHYKAVDRNGEPFEREADGLLAVCIQHELDHLEGKVFVDYLSAFKRQRIRQRLAKQARQQAGKPAQPAQAAL